ncbi:coproporphyrinogen III oxidase [Platysternon megacephalum]|uniref:Coproporphyrinogen III oxidase n=1 Tax=Platysternon megacephalum TaxID=55544 RepID=A0A4D9DI92_9SAUR|nr:coproporphyrinogen III oxidase [Platysternon megacephalum]
MSPEHPHTETPFPEDPNFRFPRQGDPLSADSLFKYYTELGLCGGDTAVLRACLYTAWEGFGREPRCVQENARLLIRWDGGELEFIAGQGQCEICVSCSAGEPQYHITEKTWDMFVAWTNSHPEPLSINNLERVRDRLGRWGALGEELSGCFAEAISQFSREPPCVQENARLRLSWDRGSLEFVSGKGQYEISVSYQEGNPRYHFHVETLPGHLYVARLRSRKDPLTADSLLRFHTELGLCRGDTAALRTRLLTAWEGFSQEPQYVQENARLLIQWGRRQLRFTSGKGECEISVRCGDGKPQYHVRKIPAHVYVAQLRADRPPLSADTLQRVLSELGSCHGDTDGLTSCFDRAWQGFRQEPRCVQGNARLLIRRDGGELEFVSGQGQCEISVLLADGEPQYHITELGGDRPVTWSHASPEPLSVADLVRVWDRLGRWGALGEELSGCFGEAISQFSREPPCVQGNARLRLCWDGGSLEFLSGEGQYIFTISYQEGNPRYHFHVETLPGHLYVARLRFRKDPLTADNLFKFHTELGLCGGDTAVLRACLYTAWRGFRGEPRCVQGNARLLIRWGGGELEFVSGQGQCGIPVLLADGEPQYHITELGGDRPETWSHASREPLSVADLVRVWDRLGRWGALGEELSGCFGEAISQFSQEPRCVQGNARLLIQWGRGRLEFRSGEGQCEISVRCRDERPEYEVGELPVHMYLARLRTRPEPLSADTLRRVLRKLGSCQADTGTLRACISHALDQFVQEPQCVQENARLLICWGGGELEFVSGQGENLITVCKGEEGRIQYVVQVSGWWPWIARLLPYTAVLGRD